MGICNYDKKQKKSNEAIIIGKIMVTLWLHCYPKRVPIQLFERNGQLVSYTIDILGYIMLD